jgi:hypothetical protein
MEFSSLREKIAYESKARAARVSEFEALAARAYEAGMRAGVECMPIPMAVMDELRGQLWRVDDGACGFAWVTVRPANCAFANWAKKTGLMRKAYDGGVQYWVSEFGQSVDRKTAFAGAYARVLSEAGINAYAGSRLD